MTIEQIHSAIELALSPGRFFVAGGRLVWQHQAQERTRWEIFRGHLLDHRQTRSEAVFESWTVRFHVTGQDQAQHAISLKLAGGQGPIYVTRELLVYGEETYEPAPNVIATRPAQIVQRELVGTIDVRRLAGIDSLAAEISQYVLLAVVGTSRLPITSVESPLPAFSLGMFGYGPASASGDAPASDPAKWIERFLSPGHAVEQARVLELALRAVPTIEVPSIACAWQNRLSSLGLGADDTLRAVRKLFNQVALTPYTSLVDNLIEFLGQLVDRGGIEAIQRIDLVSFLLRQLVRHLNAFDLVTFHNQGANYPDALLLESLLSDYVSQIERRAELFLRHEDDSEAVGRMKCVRRRALRGAWVMRAQYAGHLVPDVPTSPGENARVLTDLSHHVPEEQLLRPDARRKRLFADEVQRPLPIPAVLVLAQSLDDLDDPRELVELGTALFLDRPLGLFQDAGHPDRTPLVSYEAFSRQTAVRQLQELAARCEIAALRREHLAGLLDRELVVGLPADRLPGRQATGVVTLEDALRASADFVVRRTTRKSLDELLAGYDLTPLAEQAGQAHRWLTTSPHVLLIRTATRQAAEAGAAFLTALDDEMRPRLQIALPRPGPPAYFETAGSVRLQAGLRVVQIDGRSNEVSIPARADSSAND